MVVKNEAAGIAETIRSCAPAVDCMHLHDTGSEDGTIEIARKACDAIGLPLRITTGPDIHAMGGYSGVYNSGLAKAAELGTEWILHVAGDNVLEYEHPNAIRDACTAELGFGVGARDVQRRWEPGGLTWSRPLLFRVGWGWWYEGRVHETPVCTRAGSEHLRPMPARRNFTLVYRPRETEQDWKARAARDAEWLSWDMAEKPGARTAFYLGQAHDQLGETSQALNLYAQVATWKGAWPELRYCAAMRAGRIFRPQDWWPYAHELCERPEAAYELAHDWYMQGLGMVPPDIGPGHVEYYPRLVEQARAINRAEVWLLECDVRCGKYPASHWRMNVDSALWTDGDPSKWATLAEEIAELKYRNFHARLGAA
jgi:hypothetical protein